MGTLLVGGVSNPTQWCRWPEVEALLEPARKLSDFANVIEPDEALWIVLDGDELLAAATARISEAGCEVILVGGHDHRRWLGELDRGIGAAAAEAGATRMIGMGRRGWTKSLTRLGWERHGEVDGMTVYSREL